MNKKHRDNYNVEQGTEKKKVKFKILAHKTQHMFYKRRLKWSE